MKTYLYSISRKDIPLAQQAVQAAHAGIEYARLFMSNETSHPSYIHLTARSQAQLISLRQKLQDLGHSTAEFHEPYMDWGLTAISTCLSEEHRSLLKGFQLWRLPTQEQS